MGLRGPQRSPRRYLDATFVERIRASELPILQLTSQVGWSHPNRFYRYLRGGKVTVTPSTVDRLQALAVMVGHPVNKLFAEPTS